MATRLVERQHQGEGRAAANDAPHGQVAAHQFGKSLGNRQTKAGVDDARALRTEPVERLEELGQLGLLDARAANSPSRCSGWRLA